MQDLFDKLAGNGSSTVGAVLHLGAGACQELEDFLRLKAGKVMLVEANPEIADRLRSRVRGVEQVEVVGAAVAAAETDVVLWVLNNPRESSLHRPAQLLKRYPNLRVTRELTLRATTFNKLAARLPLDGSRDNLLVLEVQGAELNVLSSAAPETLQKFSWIAIRATSEALYEGGGRLKELDALLRKTAFRPLAPRQSSASPFQEVLYRRDMQQIQLRELKAFLDEREQTIRTLTQSLAELEREAKLAAEREQKVLQLQAELAQHARSEADLKQELAEARQSVSLSIKLQALHEADLKDLQSRYRTSLSVQESQHQMLVKLGERLKAASSYFHQMAEAQALPARGSEERPVSEDKRTSRARAAGKRSLKSEGGA